MYRILLKSKIHAVGDLIIIASFAQVHEDQVAAHKPQLVFVDEANRRMDTRQQVATQQP